MAIVNMMFAVSYSFNQRLMHDASFYVKPADGRWIDLFKTDEKTRKRVPMGRVLISLELLPKALADKLPAGLGRGDPNTNPILPPPSGRLKFVCPQLFCTPCAWQLLLTWLLW